MNFSCLIVTFISCWTLSSLVFASDKNIQNEIDTLFKKANVEGTLVIANDNGEILYTHNLLRAKQQFSPASTFKILNTLIGLDTGIITSASLFKWDGEKRWLDSWNQNQTLESAFKVSCVWCYQELARKIDKDLQRIGFGNQRLGKEVDQFWLDGSLEISAQEQIVFINKLINIELPYQESHIEVVRSIMLDEEFENSRLFGKTGWAAGDINVGWYVGFVETNNRVVSFALNLDLHDAAKAPLRKKLLVESLLKLEILEKG